MATAPATPISNKPQDWRGKSQEVKAPEMVKFAKPGQTFEGVLLSIEPTVVNEKPSVEYLFEGENGYRFTFLETADLKKKIHPGLIGHWLTVRYEADNTEVQKQGQSAMKMFKVTKSEFKHPDFRS